MNQSSIIAWEDRLTRLALASLVIGTVYGVYAGAIVTMYYDITPNMGALEDNLPPINAIFYFLAIIVSFVHLPLALVDIRHQSWRQGLIRVGAFIGPLVIFLGAEGLVAHSLCWGEISYTDQFHLLHHSLFAGVPLTLLYGLALRWLWRPADFKPAPAIPRAAWILISGATIFVVVALITVMAVMMGGLSMIIP